ncbi:hypothetical protein ACIGO9_31785 [Nocardia asteroides]|uniref:hypothetical protein n=1 Tax=Nocardia asteroides TaxID=1824 RepID=UPI0037C6D441
MTLLTDLATHAGHEFKTQYFYGLELERLNALLRTQLPLQVRAQRVTDAADAASEVIGADTSARVALLARMLVSGFTTENIVHRATNATHFAAAAHISLAQEILRVRIGPPKEVDREYWRDTRITNLMLLDEAVQHHEPKLRDLDLGALPVGAALATIHPLTTSLRPSRRVEVPVQVIAAALGTLQAATRQEWGRRPAPWSSYAAMYGPNRLQDTAVNRLRRETNAALCQVRAEPLAAAIGAMSNFTSGPTSSAAPAPAALEIRPPAAELAP